MANRITISFGLSFEEEYQRLIKEPSSSKVVCEALRKYYFDKDTGATEENVMKKLDEVIRLLSENKSKKE